MTKKLTRSGNSLALILDKPLLEAAGLDETSVVEVTTSGRAIVITAVPDKKRAAKLDRIIEKLDRNHAGTFKRLAK